MRNMKMLIPITLLLMVTASISGCGTNSSAPQPTTTSKSPATTTGKSPATGGKKPGTTSGQHVFLGAGAYQGKGNLQKFSRAAQASPHSEQAQLLAGVSAYDNGQYTKAIAYYKRAAALNPKDGVPYNNIGNVYFRGMSNPKSAVAYYQKTTKVDPGYVYGWWNLALCEAALGNKQAAQEAVKQGLAKVSKTNPYYKDLKTALTPAK